MVSTGPLSVPLFLFYGLAKGAFLATEAASSLGLYLSKSVTFQRFGALTPDIALKGLIAGSSLMFGAFIAKRFVLRLDANVFRLVMDGNHACRRAFHAMERGLLHLRSDSPLHGQIRALLCLPELRRGL